MNYDDYLIKSLNLLKNYVDELNVNKTLTNDSQVKRRLNEDIKALNVAIKVIKREIYEVTGE